ncbi:MAG: hypothetical protein WA510_19680 [Acidobacteriaceae bacterium]
MKDQRRSGKDEHETQEEGGDVKQQKAANPEQYQDNRKSQPHNLCGEYLNMKSNA